jgi:acyl-CoA reductase-like NAD-dependent aldehyde dehydrogenase
MDTLTLTNPLNEEVTIIESTPLAKISEIVQQTEKQKKIWGSFSLDERIKMLTPLLSLLEEKRSLFARSITDDMGKPIKFADAEITRTIHSMKLFLEESEAWLKDEPRGSGFITYEPLGLAFAITPWNFPLSIAMFQVIPSLIAGNVVVWKASEYAVQTSKLFYELVSKVLPSNVVSLIIGGKEHGQKLVEERADFLSFTGSTATGKYIAERVAKNLTRIQLELGGLDAAIIIDDADPIETAKNIVQRNASNSGQVCCSIKRAYVEEKIYPQFLEAAIEASRNITIGSPYGDFMMGPLSSQMQLEKCETYLADALQKGAKLHTGGKRLNQKGFYFPHTLLSEVHPDSKILHEEAFSPILPIIPVKNVNEAIELANSSSYALSASVWGNDQTRLKSIARKIDGGVIGINIHGVPPTGCPWGGAKQSGIGRGRSKEGLLENCNMKFIY